MPKLGLSLVAGRVNEILRAVGESVEEGEPLVEIESDKIETVIESPATGTVAEWVVTAGDEVEIGGLIGYLDVADA